MFGGPGEPIKAPHYNYIELPLTSVVHEFVQLRARVFCARLADINVFPNEVKSPRRAVGAEVAELQFTALVFSAHACVLGNSHGFVLRDGERNGYFRSLRARLR